MKVGVLWSIEFRRDKLTVQLDHLRGQNHRVVYDGDQFVCFRQPPKLGARYEEIEWEEMPDDVQAAVNQALLTVGEHCRVLAEQLR